MLKIYIPAFAAALLASGAAAQTANPAAPAAGPAGQNIGASRPNGGLPAGGTGAPSRETGPYSGTPAPGATMFRPSSRKNPAALNAAQQSVDSAATTNPAMECRALSTWQSMNDPNCAHGANAASARASPR
ncbi:MAG TPA: hypothetical protein VHY32_02620 [Caulobacteraceae bacterium]|nr:hypothetical protein [Caulobacteraceae bacterium]